MATNGNAPGLAPAGREENDRAAAIVAQAALTPAESARLAELEATIERGLQTFVEVGNALREIRDARLFRPIFPTFAAYCEEHWGFSRQRAHQLIAGAAVATSLSTAVDTPERVIRPLAKLDPAEQGAVWSKAKQAAGDRPVTSKHVEAAVIDTIPAARARHNNQGLWSLLRRQYPELYAKVKAGEMTLDQAQLIHIDTLAAERREGEAASRAEVTARLGLPYQTPRDRLLGAVTAALLDYQNDITAGRRGKPCKSERKYMAFGVEMILREFKKGTLKPRTSLPAPSTTTVDVEVQKATPGGKPKKPTPQDAPGRDGRRRPIGEGGGVCTTSGDSRRVARSDEEAAAGANRLLAGIRL